MTSVQVASQARHEEPSRRLLWLMAGKWFSQAICVAAELGIADLLKDGPHSTEEIATIVGVPEEGVFRLLRALASIELFSSQPGRRFALTPSGNYLRTDWPASVRGWAFLRGNAHAHAGKARLQRLVRAFTPSDGAPRVLGQLECQCFDTEAPRFWIALTYWAHFNG